MSGDSALPTQDTVVPEVSLLWTARLLTHIRKPENLLVYLCVSAWMKFMGISSHIPSVTIG